MKKTGNGEKNMINKEKEISTDDIDKCDYMFLMMRRPKIKHGKCEGFRNKYTGDVSYVCAECLNFDETIGGD